MPIWLRTIDGTPLAVNEWSTLPIEVTLRDGDGAPAEVTAASWSLVDRAGAIINGRDAVALSVTDGVARIVLSGADLARSGEGEVERRVTVRAVYDSATDGPGRHLTEEFRFYVADLAGVPAGG